MFCEWTSDAEIPKKNEMLQWGTANEKKEHEEQEEADFFIENREPCRA